MPGSRRLPALLFLCASLWFQSRPLFAQSLAPVQAELVQRLDASRVKVGDPILAKLQSPWKSSACDLRTGSIIEGHVVTQTAHSKTEKISELGVTFEKGQCGGREMKPLLLTVAVVMAPVRSPDVPETDELQPLSSAIGLSLNGNMRSISKASSTVYFEPRHAKAPSTVKPGQVVGIPHLAIQVGVGPGGASILFSNGHNVQLSPGTQFVLVPNFTPETNAPSDSKTPQAKTASKDSAPQLAENHPPEVASETELCVAPACNLALADSRSGDGVHGPQTTLPLKGLGYLPPPDREMSGFDYDASIAYLGPNQFLFTFNPHTLVSRSSAEANSFRKLRTVRGVLFDLEKNQVVKTVDWRVPDSGRYLWPIGQNRVLIHVGQELRVYGPGLQLLNQISLGEPLAFVRVSPSSEYIAAGIIHERHPLEIHREIETAELREPEEDVEVLLLDAQFKVLTTVMRSSRTAPPVLMNEGEVHIPSIGRNRWRIVENSWAGQRRVLAVATSTCRPQAESLPGNLLFVIGCDRQADDRWYRILRGDGKLVLKGWSSSSELEQTAGGNVGSNAFAIRIAEATKSRMLGSVFKPSDLKSARVTVYRATNGRQIFSIGLPDPVPAVQTFAISPSEDQLAVLGISEINFYRVSGPD
jgi:hypothetical protein